MNLQAPHLPVLMIKIAMIRVSDRIKKENLNAKMILQVHDELVFELPENEIEQMKDIVEYEMSNSMELKVPVQVDIAVGKDWYEAH